MATIMFALSGVALLWLLQQSNARVGGYVFGAGTYIGFAVVLTHARD
jgi:pantothenate kinase